MKLVINANWIAAIAAGLSVIISLISLYISYNLSTSENLSIILDRDYSYYKTNLSKTQLDNYPAVIEIFWNCTIINNSERNIVIVDFSIEQFDEGIPEYYSIIYGDLYSSERKHLDLPLEISTHKSLQILVKIGIPLKPIVYQTMMTKFKMDEQIALDDLLFFLAANNIDLFGNVAEPLYDGEDIIGIEVSYDDIKEQIFLLKFKTSRNNKFISAAFWQKINKF